MLKYLVIIVAIGCASIFALAQPVAPQSTVEEIFTSDTSIKYAVGDMTTLPETSKPYIRYLSLHNIPKAQRRDVARLVSFTINSLSRRKKMYIPVFVGASNETVIRINLKDYDIPPSAWDNLGKNGSGPKPYPEPYFHAFAIKVEPVLIEKTVKKIRQVHTGYYVHDGRGGLVPQMREEVYEVVEKTKVGEEKRVKELLPAPWLDPISVQFLEKGTQSQFPMMRADWFIVYSTVEPAYHKFLALGETEKDFENLVFANEELAKKARSQDKAVVIKSSVARNNRTLTRSPTFTKGYIWKSRDSLKSTDDRNYVQNLLDEKFDATEIIATLPNGLQAYFVGDAVGKRLDKADNEIATDHMAADRIVRNGRSCIYCHAPGINPIQDEVRTLNKKLQNREQVMLLVTDEKDYYRIDDLFSSNLDKQIVLDQQIYADAIGEATGTTPILNAQAYFSLWEGYVENLLTIEVIARDLGMTVVELEKYAKLSTDPLFLGLTKKPIRPVRRDQFERSYQDFMIMMIRAKGNQPVIKK